ncbi:MAG: cellulase family glycosylhydrolase [Candidatus Sumerlaeia bacterium]|nr:cellulase family glycosylhydrolase [Candidatus Sumerlaeia bacterium]
MKICRLLSAAMSLWLAVPQTLPAAWWETGFDRWYYKDDWEAEFLSGGQTYGTTLLLPLDITRAWLEVWSSREYTLYLNGEKIGQDCDAGTIECYDVTEVIHGGRNEIVLVASGEVIVEGGVVRTNGEVVAIRSDATWVERGKTSRRRQGGPRGYAGNAHQALMLDYTPAQRAKAAASRLRSLAGRLRDRDQYRFWQVRDVADVLALRGRDDDLLGRVLRAAAEAERVAAQTNDPIRRADWPAVERILNPPDKAEMTYLETAAAFATRISALSLRNGCRALKLQLDLLATSAPLAEPSWRARLQSIEGDCRRALDAATPESVRCRLASEGHAALGQLRTDIERRLGIRLDPLNTSTQNRLGWVISNEPMDNDPRQWEFSFAPPSADVLDLAGLWKFSLDPGDQGLTSGCARADFDDSKWKRIFAPYKWGWERLGYDMDNPAFRGQNNKPYNGLAWYRKTVVIPAAWAGRNLELDLGDRGGNNRDWLYVNGKAVAKPSSDPSDASDPSAKGNTRGLFTIPAALIQFGTTNTLAIRVYNEGNCGGLLGPRVQLYPEGTRPERLRTVCQAGIVQAATFASGARQAAYCGALCPAILVAQTENQFRIGGWETKGWPAPRYLLYDEKEDWKLRALEYGLTVRGELLAKNWLLLLPDPDQAAATSCPLALVVVLQRRPQQIRWEREPSGSSALLLDFSTSPGIVGLVRPLGRVVPLQKDEKGTLSPRPFTDSICARWGRMIRNYPVAWAELYEEYGDKARVRIGYDYLETDDDWNTEHELLAPVPMLFYQAYESGWPDARLEVCARLTPGAAHTPDPSATWCGLAMARLGPRSFTYEYNRLEPRVHWKGVGTFAEVRTMGDADFARLRAWGANACRPQIAFDADWYVKGFFESGAGGRSGLEGRLRWDATAAAWLDDLIARHRRQNLLCVLNWFWNADHPLKEIGGAPPNSARYWRHKPAARQLLLDFWSKVAEHCAGLPRDAVAYDLLNEPATVPWAEYNRFIRDATAAIRRHDTTHTIFIESANGWAQPEDFDRLEATGDPNTICEFHFYGPHAFDSYQRDIWFPRYEPHREAFVSAESLEERLLPPLRFSIRNRGAELCHGEFGITFLGPDESPRHWLEALLTLHEKYRIHWMWWNWDGEAIHRTGLVAGDRLNPLLTTLREFMAK